MPCALDPNILRTHEWHLCDTSCNTSHVDSGRYSGDKCASSSWSQYTADTCLAFMWILSLDKARFYSRVIWVYTVLGPVHYVNLRGVWCTLSFFFFFFCFVLFCFSVRSLRSAVSEPALYCLPKSFFIFITPTNHLHAKPLSIPILVNYFLRDVFM